MPEAEALNLTERLTNAAKAASLLPQPCTAPVHAWLASTLHQLKDQRLQDADIPNLANVVRVLAGSSVWKTVAWLQQVFFMELLRALAQLATCNAFAFEEALEEIKTGHKKCWDGDEVQPGMGSEISEMDFAMAQPVRLPSQS